MTLRRSAFRAGRGERDPIPKSTRTAVAERSGGICEACGAQRANHIHHRKLRSQGGTNDLVNLLHLDQACHRSIHADVEDSYQRGLLVRRSGIPAMVPVQRYEAVE